MEDKVIEVKNGRVKREKEENGRRKGEATWKHSSKTLSVKTEFDNAKHIILVSKLQENNQ